MHVAPPGVARLPRLFTSATPSEARLPRSFRASPHSVRRNSKTTAALLTETCLRETGLQRCAPMFPTIAEAHELLRQAGELNPGPWLDHSRVAARAAQSIAARHPDLEPDRAYVLALLH